MNYYKRALELKNETIEHRRFFHENAEIGLDMPKAVKYVLDRLTECKIECKKCGHGVSAVIGNGGKCILLRADMDALPLKEETGLDFAPKDGKRAHACGHDFHAAMLLTAAKMLKENENELYGTVKLMFQPAEETLEGAKDMVENGILEDPAPDAALAYHVTAGRTPVGVYMYNDSGTMMCAASGFKVRIFGRGAHGAYPHSSVDPINIGVHIYLALEAIIAREADPQKQCVISVGSFNAGTAHNIIPDTAELWGAVRTSDADFHKKLVKRVEQAAVKTAEAYSGRAEVEIINDVPPLVCNSELTKEMAHYMESAGIPDAVPYNGITAGASEDFAIIAEKIPATFMYLSAGFSDERGDVPAHNPKVQFNEDVCPIGAAAYAHCAHSWLKEHMGK